MEKWGEDLVWSLHTAQQTEELCILLWILNGHGGASRIFHRIEVLTFRKSADFFHSPHNEVKVSFQLLSLVSSALVCHVVLQKLFQSLWPEYLEWAGMLNNHNNNKNPPVIWHSLLGAGGLSGLQWSCVLGFNEECKQFWLSILGKLKDKCRHCFPHCVHVWWRKWAKENQTTNSQVMLCCQPWPHSYTSVTSLQGKCLTALTLLSLPVHSLFVRDLSMCKYVGYSPSILYTHLIRVWGSERVRGGYTLDRRSIYLLICRKQTSMHAQELLLSSSICVHRWLQKCEISCWF